MKSISLMRMIWSLKERDKSSMSSGVLLDFPSKKLKVSYHMNSISKMYLSVTRQMAKI